jgi:hypothetical protein
LNNQTFFFHYNCPDNQMASFFTVIRINVIFALRQCSLLFMHAGLNNSELISTRGMILRKWQKQRKNNYYLLYRQQDEPISVFAWLIVLLKEQKDSATFTSYGNPYYRSVIFEASFTKIGIRFRKRQIVFSIFKIRYIIHWLFNRKDILRFGTYIHTYIACLRFFTMIW